MKITTKDGTIVHLDDNSEEVRKINLGHKYDIINGEFRVLEERDTLKSDLIEKCKTDKLTMKDVQVFILHYLTQNNG